MKKWLVSADWHVRGDRPRCRTDEDWIGTQRACIREVLQLALDLEAVLLLVGDIFNTARISTEALCMVVEEFARFKSAGGEAFILAGNHDLPYHDHNLVSQSSFGVLRGLIPEIQDFHLVVDKCMDAAPFGKDNPTGAEYAMTHRLVFPDKASIPPGCEAATAREILKEFPSRMVFTGDYHHAFTSFPSDKWNGYSRVLVNPGCLNRQTVDMKGYLPLVALVDPDEMDVEKAVTWISLKADLAVGSISDEHIISAKERDARIEAFVEKVRGNRGISLSFMDNLNAKLPTTPQGVQAITSEIIQRSKDTKGQS